MKLQVLGNAKGIVAAGISILIFRNPITSQGALGYAVTLLGVALYSQVSTLIMLSRSSLPFPFLLQSVAMTDNSLSSHRRSKCLHNRKVNLQSWKDCWNLTVRLMWSLYYWFQRKKRHDIKRVPEHFLCQFSFFPQGSLFPQRLLARYIEALWIW